MAAGDIEDIAKRDATNGSDHRFNGSKGVVAIGSEGATTGTMTQHTTRRISRDWSATLS